MERKLSEKASKMRQRLTFSRHRASTLNSSANTPSTPNSRPRSATTPVSSHQPRRGGGTWDNPPSRYYDFTDELGYFRPASPLIHRQEIAEELEDDMKHACAMLVHSIERGLPIWPTASSNLRPNTGTASVAHAETETEPGTRPIFHDQTPVPAVSPNVFAGTEVEIPAGAEMHDSGVAFSNQSSSSAKAGKTGQNSLSGTGVPASAGRFYGRQLSTSPRDKETFDQSRARGRGRSFATEPSSIRSRSRSSSPVLFPYSPPQADAQWCGDGDEDKDNNNNNKNDTNLAPPDDLLSAEGVTWLRASLDVHRRCEPEQTQPHTQGHGHPQSKNETGTSTPQPRRFYGTRRLPSEKIFRPHEWAHEVASSRGSSLCDASSVRSLAFEDEKQHWVERNLHGHCPSRRFDNSKSNAEAVYSVLSGTQPRHRRGRATQLLRRLVGIRRKEEEEGGESRRVHRALVAAA